MTKYLTEHKVFDRAAQAQLQTDTYGLTTALSQTWESIDRDHLRACLHAERIAKSRDRPAWSPKLHHASMIVTYWKITLSSIRTERDATQQLERLLLHITRDRTPLAPSKSDFIAKLRDSQQIIRTIRKDATTHRSDFLQERAASEALAGNEEVAKVL